MISFVNGILADVDESGVVIDVGGVGYQILTSPGTASRVGPIGSQARLYTYTYLREDQIALYGFLSKDELSLFKQLITVSGIGPKGAQAILAQIGADELRFAILSGDTKLISTAPGIGKKTAERLVLDLRDKVGALPIDSVAALAGAGAPEEETAGAKGDAIAALTALGYGRAEAVRAVDKASQEGAEDAESLLRQALKYLF